MKVFKNQSIPLVKVIPQTNQLCLTSQAINFLSSLSNPLAIITIAGLYRTGKSYLVNKLLPSTYGYQMNSTFKVGTTTQSMTKGLNILATPITLPCQQTGQSIDYLLIDSQGIGSCEQSIKYDTNLLILIFLISSTVVYNSMGAIDQQGLQQLQVVLKLKNCVQNTQHQYQSCLFKYSSAPPKFIWVLRDFALQLTDKNGKQISPDQYLQQCLEQSNNNTSTESKKKNQIRKAIKQNLGQRHCYTLVRPTIKEEDLQHLANHRQQPTKIRKQFIGQIECLKQSLFRGTLNDIKRINSQPITGKLFARILSQYLSIINKNQLPQVGAVWNSVLKINNEEQFQQLTITLKNQIKSIKLPLTKPQLKMKITQIQNHFYQQLEKNILNEQQFKIYHKEFIKLIKKLNKQIKQKNKQLYKNHLLTELHLFVKQNLNYQTIKSNHIAQFMKVFIQRIKYKINGIQQGYDYLISIINDVFFILEQKYSKVQRQYQQIKKQYENLTVDKTNNDLTLINLKKQYHQSLKNVAKLQENQADIDKNYMLSSNRIMGYESKIIRLESELKQNKEDFDRNMRINQQKHKTKIQQLNSQLRRVREQYQQLNEQSTKTKYRLTEKQLLTKKQLIFQQKIHETYQKFNTQKQQLSRQLSKCKKQLSILTLQYQQIKHKYTIQIQKHKQLEQNNIKKQQNIIKQFENLKKCFKDTKNSYQQTYQTIQNSDQVLKDVSSTFSNNNTSKKDKYQTPSKIKYMNYIHQLKNQQGNHNLFKKYYESQIQKNNEDHKKQLDRLQQQLQNLSTQLQKQKQSKQLYFLQSKQYKQKCLKLQNDLLTTNSKFNQFLKQMQQAKQKQRSLYQQSIVRLLSNIEKKQNRIRDNPMTNSGLSSKTRSSTGKNSISRIDKNIQNVKSNVSFRVA